MLGKDTERKQFIVILMIVFVALIGFISVMIEVDMQKQRIILLGIGLFLFLFLIYGSMRIIAINKKLRMSLGELSQLNKEFDETAKMLVRRDLELTSSNERLKDLDAAKSQFVSVAAHQLRTPLTGIKWTLDTLINEEVGTLNEQQKKFAQDAYNANDRLIDLIHDLLDMARLEEGRFGFELKSEEFLPILKVVSEGLSERARKKGVTLRLDTPRENIPPLFLDKEKIAIAVENFVENAIKYTSPGGKVNIKIAKEKDNVVVEIRDTGIGVPKKEISKLFTKFFRATNAQLFQTNGTGLGMYVAKNIIEHHGGVVHVESEERKGTTVSFSIPIKSNIKNKYKKL